MKILLGFYLPLEFVDGPHRLGLWMGKDVVAEGGRRQKYKSIVGGIRLVQLTGGVSL